MRGRTHPMFLDQAIKKFRLPEQNCDDIERYLRSEHDNNNLLALRIAEAEGTPSLSKELLRQKENSDLKIEALEYAFSKRVFLDTLQEGNKRRRKTRRRPNEREKALPASTSARANRKGRISAATKTTVERTASERQQLLHAYKLECQSRGIKVTNPMIAKEAGWSDRTPVQRWLRNDSRSTPAEDARIRRVLNKKPHLNKL